MNRSLRPALLLIVYLLWGGTRLVCAQSSDIDSLKRLLVNQPADTTRVRLLNQLSRLYLDDKPDTTYRLAQQAYRLAQQLDDKPGQARGLDLMGTSLSSLGDYAKSIRFYQQSLQISRSLNDLTAMYKVLNNMAGPYQAQKDHKRSLLLLQESYRILKQIHHNDAQKEVLTYGIMYGNLGEAYLFVNQLDSADNYLKQALFFSKQRAGILALDHTLYNLGNLQLKRHNPAAALTYYRQGLAAARHNNATVTLADVYLRIATLYQATGPVDSSLVNARRALAAGQQSGYLQGILSASELLTQLYEGHDNTQALRYYKVAVATRDSLFSQEKVKQLLTLDFEEQQRRQELAATEEAYQNRIRTYGLSGLVGVVLLVAGLLWRTNRRQYKSNQLLSHQKQEIEQERSKAQHALTELQAAQNQLIQQEKMASLGELTAGIAHEIQNPLNFVNNFSEVSTELVEELREGPMQHLPEGEKTYADELLDDLTRNLQKITHHGKRADTIVKGMLAHSRTSTGSPQPTNLNTLANEYLQLAYQGLRRSEGPVRRCDTPGTPAEDKNVNASLVTHFAPNLGKVEVVPQDIGRVLLNLFNNAFYAVHQKQEQVSQVSAGESEADIENYVPTVSVQTRRIDGQSDRRAVEIQVRDNGTGMSESVRQKIFQPFFTTKPAGEGTGLGLSLSYDIITKGHGGTLTVDSQEGEGTTFTIQLPV